MIGLRWEDPDAAADFLQLREQLRTHGWLPDPSRDALLELISESEVVTGKVGSDEGP